MIRLPAPIGTISLIDVFEEYEEPLLYTAQNERGETFLAVLAADSRAEQTWHFAYVSPRRLRDIRAGVVDLHDAFLLVEGGWVTVLHREKRADGRVWTEAVRAADLTDATLPDPGERVEVVSSVEVFPNVRVIAEAQRRDVVTFRLIPKHRARHEVAVAPLARLLEGTQASVEAIDESLERAAKKKAAERPGYVRPKAKAGTIPPDPRERTRLTAASTFDGSFGIELHAEALADLNLDSAISDALGRLVELLRVVGDEAALMERMGEFRGSPTATKLRNLLTGLSHDITELHVDWASPKPGRGGRVTVTREQADIGIRTLTRLQPDEPVYRVFVGVFDGAEHEKKLFTIKEEGPDGGVYRGKIDEAAARQMVGLTLLDRRYKFTIREVVEHDAIGTTKVHRTLMEFEPFVDPSPHLPLPAPDTEGLDEAEPEDKGNKGDPRREEPPPGDGAIDSDDDGFTNDPEEDDE